jgi:cytochrome c-type biogenesis protein
MIDQLALDVPGIVFDGSLLLAVPLAFLAGLVSFLSPCVLPLAPGYLAYVAGLTGADLAEESADSATDPALVDLTGQESLVSSEARDQTVITRRGLAANTSKPTGASASNSTENLMSSPDRPGNSLDSGSKPNEIPIGNSGARPTDTTRLIPNEDRGPGSSDGRGRVLTGSILFVLGFSAVFVSYGVVFGGLGSWLLMHQRQISVVMGIMVIIMGLGYLGLPGLSNRMWWNTDRRSHARPSRGLWGAPLLGVLFGLGWTPCIGPTLAAVQTLAFTEASATRGAVLSLAYCLGLGLPFIGLALGLRAVAGATAWTRRHYLAIARFGGVMLIAIGILLVTGWWNDIVAWLQGLLPGFTAVV